MPKQRQKLANPFGGAGGGGPQQQQFLGIGNPNGATINFNNDELVKEAELSAILGEDEKPAAPKKTKKPARQLMPWDQLGSMVDECMVDVDEVEDGLDDADFEDELADMLGDEEEEQVEEKPVPVKAPPPPPAPSRAAPAPVSPQSGGNDAVSILTLRVEQYTQAVQVMEGSKKKRMERQLKSVQQLLKKAKSGVQVNIDDIPSPPAGIGLNTKKESPQAVQTPAVQQAVQHAEQPPQAEQPPEQAPPQPVQVEKEVEQKNEDDIKLQKLTSQRDAYKQAALSAKKNNDKATAIENLTKMKAVQAAIDQGNLDFVLDEKGQSVPEPVKQEPKQAVGEQAAAATPKPASTPLEALLQRRVQFDETAKKAQADGNSSKARRYGRIIKQYDQAIRELKKGGQPDLAALPDLPNMAPIPGYAKKEITLDDAINAANASEETEETKTPVKKSPPKPPPKVLQHQLSHEEMPQLPGATKAGSDGSSRYQQQLDFLLNRHDQFKKAALSAKQAGDRATAMSHLKSMKGMEKMIEAAKKGLPVDIRQLPPAPVVAPVVEMSRPELARQDSTGLSARLLNDLASQVKRARSLSTQFTQLGNVDKAALMEKWAATAQRDWDIVRLVLT